MNWLEQVGHVFAKDVRENWRAIALYTLVVAIATLQAVGWRLLSAGAFGGTMTVVVEGGLFIAGMVVQGDSPTRSDAFWASHPFHPSAILGAKLCTALLLVTIAAIGQIIAVASFDMRGADVLAALIRPMLMYGAWLLGAMTIAALLRDLRSFALALIGIPIAGLAAFALMESSMSGRHELSPEVAMVGASIGAVLALSMLTWLYRTRDARLGTRLAGFVLASSALLAITADVPDAYGSAAPANAGRVALTLERAPSGKDSLELGMVLHVAPFPKDVELALHDARILVRLRDGSSFALPVEESLEGSSGARPYGRTPIELRSGGPASADSSDAVRWLGNPRALVTPTAQGRIGLRTPLTPEQRRRIDIDATSIALDGRVLVRRATQLATLPLVAGSELTEAGRRFRVERWADEPSRRSVLVSMRSVRRPLVSSSAKMWDWANDIQYALANPTAHEAIALQRQNSSSGILGLVLPGSFFRSETVRLQLPSGITLGDAWYRDAGLAISAQVPLGSYPVRVETGTK